MEKFILNALIEYGFTIEEFNILGMKMEGYVGVHYEENNIFAVIVATEEDYRIKINSALSYLKLKGCNYISLDTVLILNTDNITKEQGESFYNGDSGIIYVNNDKKVIGAMNANNTLVKVLREKLNNKTSSKLKKTNILTVTNILILINVILYIISAIKSHNLIDINPYVLLQMGAKYNGLIIAGQYYRLITAMFLHGGIFHLVLNMYALKAMGQLVENTYGKKKFLAIYFISGIASTTCSFIFSPYLSIGASGAIFGLLGAALILGYRRKDRIGPDFLKNIISVIIVNILIGVSIPNIDNFAHFGGLLAGVIVSYMVYKE